MTSRNLIAVGASALTLSLVAALAPQSSALAQPSGKAAAFFPPRPKPAASSPRDVSPKTASCDCPMMKGDAAMRDTCMSMMGAPASPPKG